MPKSSLAARRPEQQPTPPAPFAHCDPSPAVANQTTFLRRRGVNPALAPTVAELIFGSAR